MWVIFLLNIIVGNCFYLLLIQDDAEDIFHVELIIISGSRSFFNNGSNRYSEILYYFTNDNFLSSICVIFKIIFKTSKQHFKCAMQ